jgi:hypothetical protein
MQQYGKMCFLCGQCKRIILETTGATQQLAVGSLQVNTRRSEHIEWNIGV